MCLIEWPFFGVYPIFRHTHLVHRYLVISKWGNMVSISPDISGGCFNFTIALETSPRHQQVYCGGNVYINIMVTRKIVEIPRKSIDTWWVYMGLPVYHLYVYWRVIDEIHGFYSWKYRLKWKRPRGISLRIFHRVCMTEAWIHSIQHQHLWILMIFCTLKIPAHSMSSEHALYDYIYKMFHVVLKMGCTLSWSLPHFQTHRFEGARSGCWSHHDSWPEDRSEMNGAHS